MAYNNFDFYIPQNGSLYVEVVDDFNQFQNSMFNPFPPTYPDLSYPNMYGNQQFNMNPRTSFGVMRFGPSYTILGPHPPEIPPGGGIYDPNLVVLGVPSFNIGIY